MRDAWTDPRLDDLNHRVDSGFQEITREFQAVRLEIRTEFASVRSEMKTEFAAVRSEMKTEFASVRLEIGTELRGVRSEMAALNRTMLQIGAGAIATLVVGFTAILVQV